MTTPEVYISVDIETGGPIPGQYDMLSLGACLVSEPSDYYYVEFRPFAPCVDREAVGVAGLSLADLAVRGREPVDAMAEFAGWIEAKAGTAKAVFVGFNAAFDWSFVNWYFHRFVGRNPFGFSALDIKAYYMGLSDCQWVDTSLSKVPHHFKVVNPATHNSLSDAQAQAAMFSKMREYNLKRSDAV